MTQLKPTNQEAIAELRRMASTIEWDYPISAQVAINMAITALRRPTWVSVADRLPEDSEDVLVWGLNQSGAGNYYNAYFNASDEVWYFDDCAPVSVTHWMSLPNEPEVDA